LRIAKSCVVCQAEFQAGHQRRTTCSPACQQKERRAASRPACIDCGITVHHGRCKRCRECKAAHKRAYGKAQPEPVTKDCAHCFARFVTTTSLTFTKYCEQCRHKSGGLHPKFYRKTYSLDCSECGAGFVSANKNQAYCSRECGYKGRPVLPPRPEAITKEILVLRKWGNRAEPLRKARSIAGKRLARISLLAIRIACRECGGVFCPTGRSKLFCSSICAKRDEKRTSRKAYRYKVKAAKVGSVNPSIVFANAGWSCQQCGCETPINHRGTHLPTAPELDHIIPIAKGGEHSYSNTQCLCRSCNAAKSDTIPDSLISLYERGVRAPLAIF
jgi:hypothetical protein